MIFDDTAGPRELVRRLVSDPDPRHPVWRILETLESTLQRACECFSGAGSKQLLKIICDDIQSKKARVNFLSDSHMRPLHVSRAAPYGGGRVPRSENRSVLTPFFPNLHFISGECAAC